MPRKQEFIEIKANNIHAAAGEILYILDDTRKGNMMYFDGWDGLGASAALRVVAQCLKSSTRLNNFEKVIHVDCSMWKSKRALQKAVAEEVELPQSVMAIFDRCDEEDDFNGLDHGSRGVIADIRKEIFGKLLNTRFVVIFINGSSEYIDLYECGVPVTGLLDNSMLWTFGGRFRMFPPLEREEELQEILRQIEVFIAVSPGVGSDGELWDVVREEAEEVVNYTGIPEPDMKHKMVEDCFLHAWVLRDADGVDWGTHASNYWVCDGIVQGNNTSAWEIGDALHRNMSLVPYWKAVGNDMRHCLKRRFNDRWILATRQYRQQQHSVPAGATSFFFLASEPPTNTVITIPAAMFQCSEKSQLHVLHLSWCMFSFASPPFLCCNNLRFILLDHCKDENTNITEEKHQSHGQSELWRTCFGKLWVLDLSYTDWSWLLSEKMLNIMADLRELHVKGLKHWSISDLRASRTSPVKLRVTSDNHAAFPDLSEANNLKVVILDGCVGLEQVIPNVLPPSLESFSFFNKGGAAAKTSSISFRGCSQLKSIVLRGLFGSLREIDLSGTAVKTLDLRAVQAQHLKRLIMQGCEELREILWPSEDKITKELEEIDLSGTMVKTLNLSTVQAQHLKRLIMLGCKELCEILWPPEDKITKELEVLHIDTTRSASSVQAIWEEKNKAARTATKSSSFSAATKPDHDQVPSFDFIICTKGARLLGSLVLLRGYIRNYLHMEMDSSSADYIVASGGSEGAQGIRSLQQPDYYIYARDVVLKGHLQDAAANGVIPYPSALDWYVHIQDEEDINSRLVQQQGSTGSTERSSTSAYPPDFILDKARTLHVHDNLSITSVPFRKGSNWKIVKWCRVEKCPKLVSIFTSPQDSAGMNIFYWLQSFWASQLLRARYIWNWSTTSQPAGGSFEDLQFLHLDNCPRLIHVLPLSMHMNTLRSLETLEIVCCGDLREIFPLDRERQEKQAIIEFFKLKRIHLYELPMLQHICGHKMSTPNLETIKIRGCWSLRRLPGLGNYTKPPEVDCQKEWWINLEWDGVETNHHPSRYHARHSS